MTRRFPIDNGPVPDPGLRQSPGRPGLRAFLYRAGRRAALAVAVVLLQRGRQATIRDVVREIGQATVLGAIAPVHPTDLAPAIRKGLRASGFDPDSAEARRETAAWVGRYADSRVLPRVAGMV